jgi:hypothetical protein
VSHYWNKHAGPVKLSQDNAGPVKVIKTHSVHELFHNIFTVGV